MTGMTRAALIRTVFETEKNELVARGEARSED
jgi:hypothetical protein